MIWLDCSAASAAGRTPGKAVGKDQEKSREGLPGRWSVCHGGPQRAPASNTADEYALSCCRHRLRITRWCQLTLWEKQRRRNWKSQTRTHCSLCTQTTHSRGVENNGGLPPFVLLRLTRKALLTLHLCFRESLRDVGSRLHWRVQAPNQRRNSEPAHSWLLASSDTHCR